MTGNINKILLTAGMAAIVSAAYIFLNPHVAAATDGAGPCTSGTLADYQALGLIGCEIDDKRFFNFTYSTEAFRGASPIPASGVIVTPDTTLLNPGFTFQALWQITGFPEEMISNINYTVEVLPGGALITDASLSMKGAIVSETDFVAIAKNLCLGGGLPSCPGGFRTLHVSKGLSPGETSSAVVAFAGTALIDVNDHIVLTSVEFDSAKFDSFSNNFSESVPEPATFSLMGTGLLGTAALLRLRRTRPTD